MKRAAMDPLPTRVAHAGWDTNRYFGFAVSDLQAAHETFTGMVTLAVSGRSLPPAERAVLDDIAVAVSLADPRIWPLKMVRVISAYGGCLTALAAIFLALEGATIGHFTFGHAATLLLDVRREAPDLAPQAVRATIERRLRSGERLIGFGVPFRPRDERLVLLRRSIVERGRDRLPFWLAMEAAAVTAGELKGLEPNIGMGVAAACLDLGFTPREIALLGVTLAQTDFLANAVEGSEQRPAVLRRLPDDRIEYVGAPPRSSPRALRGRVE
jgi:hypothetical protein